jgi:hypothetical protein
MWIQSHIRGQCGLSLTLEADVDSVSHEGPMRTHSYIGSRCGFSLTLWADVESVLPHPTEL